MESIEHHTSIQTLVTHLQNDMRLVARLPHQPETFMKTRVTITPPIARKKLQIENPRHVSAEVRLRKGTRTHQAERILAVLRALLQRHTRVQATMDSGREKQQWHVYM